MAPRKKNPAIKSSGTTSSKASPLPDWVKGGGPKPPPSYTKAGKELQAQKTKDAAPDNASGGPSSAPSAGTAGPSQREMLFPPGSKTPLNMLYERVNKLPGWEKPIVEPRRHKEGYSCAVTLKKVNKKDASNPFTVIFEPKEPGLRLECQSSLEAKHWGATYALFRIFNHLSLNLALPPGPREYWVKMEAYKKTAPSHQDWMWENDPFEAAAKREAEKAKKESDRQAAADAANRGEVGIVNGKLNGVGKPLSKAWQEAKEVRLASALREKIEATIRRAMSIFPSASTAPLDLIEEDQDPEAGSSTPKVDAAALEKELTSYGFRRGHARSAISWLTSARTALANPSSSGASSLTDPMLASAATLADREAALEYLMLYTPEEDLPTRFKPSTSSESFITASKAGAGGDALALGWAIDKLSNQAGFPRKTVQAVFKRIAAAERSQSVDLPRAAREGLALEMLLRQMAGWDAAEQTEDPWTSNAILDAVLSFPVEIHDEDKEEIESKRADERMAVEAVLGEDRVVVPSDHERLGPHDYDITIAGPGTSVGGKEDVRLRISSHPYALYPLAREKADAMAIPAFCVVSKTLPSYLKLALTQHLLRAFEGENKRPDWFDAIEVGDGGVLLSIVEELESTWSKVVDDPPLLNSVMQHLVATEHNPSVEGTPDPSRAATPTGHRNTTHKRRAGGGRPLRRDAQVDAHLQRQQQQLHSSPSFSKMASIRNSLPAASAAGEILELIRTNRVVIIAGETGCGKTTQVPQFILDQAIEAGSGSECNIVVTQPRRVSAIGVASRVAVERGEDLDGKKKPVASGSLVGYAIRGERRASRECRLLFTTTGVLLRRLGAGGDADLKGISHVVVDEVHERNVDSDFLLLELRELLKRNHQIKVVLMSATINQETFASYFGRAPCISIPGRTFPVEDYYLEDIVRDSGFQPSGNEFRYGARGGKQIEEEMGQLRTHLQAQKVDDETMRAVESVSRSGGRISYELIGAVVRYVVERAENEELSGAADASVGGAILVFCPGVGEIRQAIDAISTTLRGQSKVDLLPLHANLSPDEQRRVFQPVRSGHRKIVVSTNVAETSITIPDVSYVVDTGRVKETRFEPESGLTRLVECWASRAACKQRRGRAGRVRAGECFRLYTRFVDEKKMAAQQTPEMRRVPLESLFLEVKSMREDEDVKEYLNKALDPPSLASMDAALSNLIEAGALRADRGYKSRLTSLGKHLAQLPLDLRLAKLLIMGTIFGCLGPMLTVASIMSCKPLFSAPFEKRDEVSKARASFAIAGCKSDLLADAAAFEQWQTMRADRTPNGEIRNWCESHFISQSTLRDIQTNRLDLLSHLQEMGFVANHYSPFGIYDDSEYDRNAHHTGILRSIVMAGLWPSVVRIDLPSAKFDQSSSGTVQREAEARQVRYFDRNGRVFLHPSSTLFSCKGFDSSYLTSFAKSSTGAATDSKVYLRDATEVPLFGLLLFGGKLKINHFAGGIGIGTNQTGGGDKEENWVRLRANARIGVLCAQLRRLLDAVLDHAIDEPQDMFAAPGCRDVLGVIGQVLERDGLAG
ncbi:Helicase-associated domain protein [Kalmanozyma brasiliensis GHG001]|uniref:ATP-dependent RNA helicase A n=1 Tax=Kalmanozyma brasiliensis (strain GHG001) TaxID=1365824 RepID=V5EA45_KALBG|nr:Helicase-associated domain protein [Kalmanozyma brasiliensis GHG001]EST07241.1 Helicase-associated domain protein [Kalmanozyma brasiliensis GHG001]